MTRRTYFKTTRNLAWLFNTYHLDVVNILPKLMILENLIPHLLEPYQIKLYFLMAADYFK